MTDEFNLSDSEIVVMRILWTLGDISSEEIIAAIPDFYQWSPSTVRTF
ncbi:BlaI/MecI/CopY family transcriptional regulator [Lactococcus fujiensis]|nr:BlaI/MecI/CopY family transcriptional regulator [Lactococcus fujiensis]